MNEFERMLSEKVQAYAGPETDAVANAVAVAIRHLLLELDPDQKSDLVSRLAGRLDRAAAEMANESPDTSRKITLMSPILHHTDRTPGKGN